MTILDLFCGAGGASRGYADAGHRVYGVDLHPQKNYLASGAADFLHADALEVLRRPWISRVDFIHASPPCQRNSRMSNCRPGLAATYPDLVPEVRELLIATRLPYVIEQPQGGAVLIRPVTLCGWQFGYETYRHRWFEAGGGLVLDAPPARPEPPASPRACGLRSSGAGGEGGPLDAGQVRLRRRPRAGGAHPPGDGHGLGPSDVVELPGPEAAVLVQAGYAVRTGTVQDERMERPDTRGHYKRGVTGEK